MKFHSITSSCLFNRGTTFSQTVAYNNNVFLPADTKSTVQTHTFCTTLVNKNRTFYNSVAGWITSVNRPVTSLEHQEGQGVFREGPTSFKLCPIFFNYVQHIFPGGPKIFCLSVKRNFWLHAMCACTEQHSTYKIRWENWWLGLRVWCLGKCVGLGFMLQLEKTIIEVKDQLHYFSLVLLIPVVQLVGI